MLYKYLAKKHFEDLMGEGSVRVGTLHGYKNGAAGTMVNDSMEGSKRLSGSYLTMNKETIEKSSSMNRILGLEHGAVINDLSMIGNTITGPDCFIFSMSSQYSEEEHRKWGEEEGYDTCYKINFPAAFFRRVTRALSTIASVEYLGLFEVQYYDEKKGMDWFDPKESLSEFRLKDCADFSGQNEMRAVWRPLGTNEIEPIILCNKLLSSDVELYRSRT